MATKGEDEDEVLGSNTHWKDSDVDAFIALHGEKEPKFVKNGKKKVLYIALQSFKVGPIGAFL